jgi:hypothetical protein
VTTAKNNKSRIDGNIIFCPILIFLFLCFYDNF